MCLFFSLVSSVHFAFLIRNTGSFFYVWFLPFIHNPSMLHVDVDAISNFGYWKHLIAGSSKVYAIFCVCVRVCVCVVPQPHNTKVVQFLCNMEPSMWATQTTDPNHFSSEEFSLNSFCLVRFTFAHSLERMNRERWSKRKKEQIILSTFIMLFLFGRHTDLYEYICVSVCVCVCVCKVLFVWST